MIASDSPLIYFAPVEAGGLCDYAVEQILALREIGTNVVVVGTAQLSHALNKRGVSEPFIELPDKTNSTTKVGRAVSMLRSTRRNAALLARAIKTFQAKHVLLSAFAEYFAPFWAGALRKLNQEGVRFGVVVHDPVRDFRLGPKWWHKRSIRDAYSFVDVAYVHSEIELDTGDRDHATETKTIPHGVYEFPVPKKQTPKNEIRRQLGLPESAPVALSFGHIRDGKNLDVAIEAMKELPDFFLLVAGQEQSSAQKPVSFYQDVASSHGVQNRCIWVNDFIPEKDVWKYFAATDFLLLLYSKDFRSASGVLNTAIQFEKPVVASGGDGPLKSLVSKYQLGEWINQVTPSSTAEIIRRAVDRQPECNWIQYRADNSWQRNAHIVYETMFNTN